MVRFLRRDFRPPEQLKEDRIHFDIDLFDDGTYELEFNFDVENRVLKAAVESMMKQQRKIFRVADLEEEFEKMDFFMVDPRMYNMIARRLKGIIKQVEEQVRQDFKEFKIVTGKINAITFERTESGEEGEEGEESWIAHIWMEGEYVAIL